MSMSHSSTTVIESQVDWLTCATHTDVKTHQLSKVVGRLVAEEARAKMRPRPFRLNGYEGYAVGRVRAGWRGSAGLVQLSGQMAEDNLAEMADLADSITRIDIAVTAQTAEANPHIGGNHYDEACNHYAQGPGRALPSRTTDAAGGYTVYVGHRTSDFFLRIYNKEAEQRADHDERGAERYHNCWRYELELKGLVAPSVALHCAATSDRPAYVQGYVYGYARAHGLEPVFGYEGDRVLLPGFRRRTDRDSRLRWFAKQVAPAIREALSQGDAEEVLDALGLDLVDFTSDE